MKHSLFLALLVIFLTTFHQISAKASPTPDYEDEDDGDELVTTSPRTKGHGRKASEAEIGHGGGSRSSKGRQREGSERHGGSNSSRGKKSDGKNSQRRTGTNGQKVPKVPKGPKGPKNKKTGGKNTGIGSGDISDGDARDRNSSQGHTSGEGFASNSSQVEAGDSNHDGSGSSGQQGGSSSSSGGSALDTYQQVNGILQGVQINAEPTLKTWLDSEWHKQVNSIIETVSRIQDFNLISHCFDNLHSYVQTYAQDANQRYELCKKTCIESVTSEFGQNMAQLTAGLQPCLHRGYSSK